MIAGPLLGIAGTLARVDDRAWVRAVAVVLPGAVFVGEAVYQATINHDGAVAGLLVVIGILLTPLLARSGATLTRHHRVRAGQRRRCRAVGGAYAAVTAVLS